MKYEGQLVLLGFILGIALAAGNVIILNRGKRKTENCHKILLIEFEAFYLNSLVGMLSILMGTLSLTYAIGAAVQGYWVEKGASAFHSFLICLVIALIYLAVLWATHPSILMESYIDRRVYMKSIKSEEFTRYSDHIWASEHWIRVGERFIPKTCLVGLRLDVTHYRGRVGYTLLTIDGREKYCRMAYSGSEYAMQEEGILEELVTTKHFYNKLNWPNTVLLGPHVDLGGRFANYLEMHKELDLINDPTFVDEFLGEWD